MYLFTKHGFEAPKEFLVSLKGKFVKTDIPFFSIHFSTENQLGKQRKNKSKHVCMSSFIHKSVTPPSTPRPVLRRCSALPASHGALILLHQSLVTNQSMHQIAKREKEKVQRFFIT
jgi:hypothetical protein